MRLNRLFGMVMVQAPEPGDGTGSGGGNVPAPGPKPDESKPPEPKAAEPKPAEPEKKAEPEPEPEPDKKPKPEAKKGKAREVIATLEQKVAELSQTREADRKEIVDERWDIALERAGIRPEYRKFVRGELGELDLKSDEGKAKVDDFARAHAAMTTRGQSQGDPVSAWVDKTKTAAAKVPTSAIANMPRSFLENYARNSVEGGQ